MNFSSEELLQLEQKVSKIVHESASSLKQLYQKQKEVLFKPSHSPVTQYDIDTENLLKQKLEALLPEAGFIVEEGKTSERVEYNWTIDPIDGTRNFVGQMPMFYVQCALLYKGEPILGVIYNPVSDQLLSASLGNKCRLNGLITHRPSDSTIEDSLVDVDFGPNNNGIEWKLAVVKSLAERCSRLRMSGGAFAPYIVTGAIDIFIVLNETTKTVDQMPRIILAREAGLQAEVLTIGNKKIFITTPPPLFETVKTLVTASIV